MTEFEQYNLQHNSEPWTCVSCNLKSASFFYCVHLLNWGKPSVTHESQRPTISKKGPESKTYNSYSKHNLPSINHLIHRWLRLKRTDSLPGAYLLYWRDNVLEQKVRSANKSPWIERRHWKVMDPVTQTICKHSALTK